MTPLLKELLGWLTEPKENHYTHLFILVSRMLQKDTAKDEWLDEEIKRGQGVQAAA
jgi:hypothetical protein